MAGTSFLFCCVLDSKNNLQSSSEVSCSSYFDLKTFRFSVIFGLSIYHERVLRNFLKINRFSFVILFCFGVFSNTPIKNISIQMSLSFTFPLIALVFWATISTLDLTLTPCALCLQFLSLREKRRFNSNHALTLQGVWSLCVTPSRYGISACNCLCVFDPKP